MCFTMHRPTSRKTSRRDVEASETLESFGGSTSVSETATSRFGLVWDFKRLVSVSSRRKFWTSRSRLGLGLEGLVHIPGYLLNIAERIKHLGYYGVWPVNTASNLFNKKCPKTRFKTRMILVYLIRKMLKPVVAIRATTPMSIASTMIHVATIICTLYIVQQYALHSCSLQ